MIKANEEITQGSSALEVVSRGSDNTPKRIKELYAKMHSFGQEASAAIFRLTNKALPYAIELGGLLTQHKDKLGHGNWEDWAKAQPYSITTLKRWMTLYREQDQIHRSGITDLSKAYGLCHRRSENRINSPV
jgi:Protein of unknown function (DUF3102)